MATSSESTSKPKSAALGSVVEIKAGGEFVRPDGSRHVIVGGSVVLDEPGSFTVDGAEYVVKS